MAGESMHPKNILWLWTFSFLALAKAPKGNPVLELVRKIPHSGYSEGLTYHQDYLWHANPEKLYKIDPKTGEIKAEFPPATPYSESLVWLRGSLWNVSFHDNGIYEGKLEGKRLSFKKRGTVPETHAWGLETDGTHLIVTGNYSSKLYFLDPKTLQVVKTITVDAKDLEDLAWDGKGIWTSSFTAHKGHVFRVDPSTGKRSQLFALPEKDDCPVVDGIAYHQGQLFITGKHCPSIWVVKKPSEGVLKKE